MHSYAHQLNALSLMVRLKINKSARAGYCTMHYQFPSLPSSFMQNAIPSMASRGQEFGVNIRRFRRAMRQNWPCKSLCMPFLLAGHIHNTSPIIGFSNHATSNPCQCSKCREHGLPGFFQFSRSYERLDFPQVLWQQILAHHGP